MFDGTPITLFFMFFSLYGESYCSLMINKFYFLKNNSGCSCQPSKNRVHVRKDLFLYTTFLNNCGRGYGFGNAPCVKTVVGGK